MQSIIETSGMKPLSAWSGGSEVVKESLIGKMFFVCKILKEKDKYNNLKI